MTTATKLTAALSFLLVVSCSSQKKEADNSAANGKMDQKEMAIVGQSSGTEYTYTGTPVTIAGITFTPASQWVDLGPSGMRKADYYFKPISGETDSATLSVFYFGPEGGGTIDANLDRWIAQMTMTDGSDPKSKAIEYVMTVDGLPVHVVSVTGNYNAPVGGMMSGQTVSKDDYVLVGAVVEAPEGNIFFKETGPEKTARAMAEGFLTMLKQIKKA